MEWEEEWRGMHVEWTSDEGRWENQGGRGFRGAGSDEVEEGLRGAGSAEVEEGWRGAGNAEMEDGLRREGEREVRGGERPASCRHSPPIQASICCVQV